MTSPVRSDVHVPSGARALVESIALSSIAIINNVPGPSPGGSAGQTSLGPRGYIGDTGPGIYSGHTDPPPGFGKLKDFWLNLDTYVLFGPKVSSTVWPNTGVMLRGSNISKGHGPPDDASNPQPGDAYIDVDASQIYIAS